MHLTTYDPDVLGVLVLGPMIFFMVLAWVFGALKSRKEKRKNDDQS